MVFSKDNLNVKKEKYANTFILQIEQKIFEKIDILKKKSNNYLEINI